MHTTPKLGDIGEPQRRREYEPMPEQEPVHEPAAPTPAQPAEPVPA